MGGALVVEGVSLGAPGRAGRYGSRRRDESRRLCSWGGCGTAVATRRINADYVPEIGRPPTPRKRPDLSHRASASEKGAGHRR